MKFTENIVQRQCKNNLNLNNRICSKQRNKTKRHFKSSASSREFKRDKVKALANHRDLNAWFYGNCMSMADLSRQAWRLSTINLADVTVKITPFGGVVLRDHWNSLGLTWVNWRGWNVGPAYWLGRIVLRLFTKILEAIISLASNEAYRVHIYSYCGMSNTLFGLELF